MKNKGLIITLIIFLSIITISLISLTTILLVKGIPFSFDITDKTELIYEDTYNIDKIDSLKINSISSDIIFKESIDNSLKVSIYGDKNNDLKVDLNNNILNIDNYIKNNICIGICTSYDRIIIEIPNTYDKNINININTTSGDITGLNLINANVTIKSVSGDVKINNIRSGEITTTSGDVTVNNIKKTNIKTVSGDIEINSITNELNLKTTSGDIEVNKIELTANSNIKTTSGEVDIDNIYNVYIDANTTSGEIDIKSNDRKAEYELKINTNSGDISVNDK